VDNAKISKLKGFIAVDTTSRFLVGMHFTQRYSGYLERFALLGGTEPTPIFPAREELFKPPIIAHDAVGDPSAGAHDLGWQ
jgi:hypothetical protein